MVMSTKNLLDKQRKYDIIKPANRQNQQKTRRNRGEKTMKIVQPSQMHLGDKFPQRIESNPYAAHKEMHITRSEVLTSSREYIATCKIDVETQEQKVLQLKQKIISLNEQKDAIQEEVETMKANTFVLIRKQKMAPHLAQLVSIEDEIQSQEAMLKNEEVALRENIRRAVIAENTHEANVQYFHRMEQKIIAKKMEVNHGKRC